MIFSIDLSHLILITITGLVIFEQNGLVTYGDVIVESQHPFVCKTEGLVRDKADPDCRTYIVCEELEGQSGKFVVHKTTCPIGYRFDEQYGICRPSTEVKCEETSFLKPSAHSVSPSTHGHVQPPVQKGRNVPPPTPRHPQKRATAKPPTKKPVECHTIKCRVNKTINAVKEKFHKTMASAKAKVKKLFG